jgi:hypothetical protein
MNGESTAEFSRIASTSAPAILRGAVRLLYSLNFAAVSELALNSGRRADLVAIGPTGELWIIEIKSSVADFRADQKWGEYKCNCDRFLFAVSPKFPPELIPSSEGLIVADEYGGTLIRNSEHHPAPAATRKTILIKVARTSTLRLAATSDPSFLYSN